MSRRLSHLVDVGGAQASLAGSGAMKGERDLLEEMRLKLNHARRCEEKRGIAGRHQRIRGNDGVIVLFKEVEERPSDVEVCFHATSDFGLMDLPVAVAINRPLSLRISALPGINRLFIFPISAVIVNFSPIRAGLK